MMNCRICKFCEIHKEINGYNSLEIHTECQLQPEQLKKLNMCPLDIIEGIKARVQEIYGELLQEEPFEMIISNDDDIVEFWEMIIKQVGSYEKASKIAKKGRKSMSRIKNKKVIHLDSDILNVIDYAGYDICIRKRG